MAGPPARVREKTSAPSPNRLRTGFDGHPDAGLLLVVVGLAGIVAGLAEIVAGLADNDPPGGAIDGSGLLAPGDHGVLLLVFADGAVARGGLPIVPGLMIGEAGTAGFAVPPGMGGHSDGGCPGTLVPHIREPAHRCRPTRLAAFGAVFVRAGPSGAGGAGA
ncbi:hypothetical protein GCM10022252_72770 [Streptosporangium oxazolinicum]|uniref:Uncharacterized protein n=1 Tax=Streptosporangium oxazolinicum TaxID=909287 RepID=A0ABP8BJ99_9ACTN